MTTYRIVGNGVAGTTAAEHIRALDHDGEITILTQEDLPFYWRIRLPDYVAGEISEKELLAKKEDWYSNQDIDLKLKTTVLDADARGKFIVTEGKEKLSYDRLLIATGSHSFIPPIQGSDKTGVFALRSVQDARDIHAWAEGVEEVILIGGGLLGLETGNALRKLGKRVMVVEFFPRLLPRQLDTDGARRLQEMMEGMGFSFRLGAKTQEITGQDRVSGVRLERGEALSGSMVIISAGVRPNLQLAQTLGLEQDKGIQVDEHLRTSQEDIYAAGDVAEYKGMPYGIWPAAMEQGKIAGTNMAGGDLTYSGTTMATSLKVVGIDLASAGNIDVENKLEAKVLSNEKVYQKVVLEDNRIVGCIMLGDTKGFNKVTRAMTRKKDIGEIKDRLLTDGFDWNLL
jgi:nitrite reductase (NADH) large subunit